MIFRITKNNKMPRMFATLNLSVLTTSRLVHLQIFFLNTRFGDKDKYVGFTIYN